MVALKKIHILAGKSIECNERLRIRWSNNLFFKISNTAIYVMQGVLFPRSGQGNEIIVCQRSIVFLRSV